MYRRGVAQPGSAPAWGVGGRQFESGRPDHNKKIGVIFRLQLWIFSIKTKGIIIFCDINCRTNNLSEILSSKNPICILIGPEGDFSEEERQFIINNKNVISITLAKNILRAETAAIASTTILNYNLENN